ncbi:MAG: hypothetical protein HRF49_11450 [bacterium]|jgi:hypothetical protein
MEARPEGIKVPMKVEYAAGWISWVAATTGCLRALGASCDPADVAGYSGYAFHLCAHETLCPSGPTILDWESLGWGARFLGRSTLAYHSGQCHTGDFISDMTRGHCRTAFELARAEVEAGRPCVLWGAYIPEFCIVTGIEGESYIVESFKSCMGQEQPPIKFDELDAPGGAYVLAFPDEVKLKQSDGDKHAVFRALELWRRPRGKYAFGRDAYDLWMESLNAKRADGGGNAYNAACYAEGRRFAAAFLARAAERNPGVGGELNGAAGEYAKAAEAMAKVAKLFPFPGSWGTPVTDENAIGEACDALAVARDAESAAMDVLEKVAAMEWGGG